jgi:hypothetical protein
MSLATRAARKSGSRDRAALVQIYKIAVLILPTHRRPLSTVCLITDRYLLSNLILAVTRQKHKSTASSSDLLSAYLLIRQKSWIYLQPTFSTKNPRVARQRK